jgi:hypothetical protein
VTERLESFEGTTLKSTPQESAAER